MKNIFKETLLAIAVAATPASAFAGVNFVFNPTVVAAPGGPGITAPFTADEITITSIGNSTITLRDTSAPYGVIGTADDLVETNIFSAVNFKNKGVNIIGLTSGINLYYDLFADFTLIGTTRLNSFGNLVYSIGPASGATLYFDSNANGLFDAATSTAIGKLTLGQGDCVITAATAFTQGSCKNNFAFDRSGVTDAGVWTFNSTDLGDLLSSITLNIGFDHFIPALSILYPGFGTTCDVGMDSGADACDQTSQVDSDGTARINISEPATLALFSLGLLGVGGLTRRNKV